MGLKVSARTMAMNSAAGMLATAFYLGSRLFLAPLVLQFISLKEYGLWSVCFTILAYAGMGGFGIHNATIRYTATYDAKGQQQAIAEMISTSCWILTLFSIFFFGALFIFLDPLLDLFRIDASMMAISKTMVLGTALGFLVDLSLGGFRAGLEGHHKIALVKKIQTALALVEFGLIYLLLIMDFGLKSLMIAYLLRVMFENILCYLFLKRHLNLQAPLLGTFSTDALRKILTFGGKVQLSGIMGMTLSSLDRLILSSTLGLQANGLFELGRKFPFTSKSVSGAAFAPLLPGSSNFTRADLSSGATSVYKLVLKSACGAILLGGLPLLGVYVSWTLCIILAPFLILASGWMARPAGLPVSPDLDLRQFFLKGLKWISILNGVLFFFLFLAQGQLMFIWLGEDYGHLAPIMGILALAYLFQQLTGPVSLVLRGIGLPHFEWIYLTIQLILHLIWLPVGFTQYGLLGGACAIMLSSLLASSCFLWLSSHLLGLKGSQIVTAMVRPLLLTALPAAALFPLVQTMPLVSLGEHLSLFLVAGILYMLAQVLIVWLFVLDPLDRNRVKTMIFPNRSEISPC